MLFSKQLPELCCCRFFEGKGTAVLESKAHSLSYSDRCVERKVFIPALITASQIIFPHLLKVFYLNIDGDKFFCMIILSIVIYLTCQS